MMRFLLDCLRTSRNPKDEGVSWREARSCSLLTPPPSAASRLPAMEEPALLRENKEGSWEGDVAADRGVKAAADWKKERSISSLLKHSCLLCWSSRRDAGGDVLVAAATAAAQTDHRLAGKASEIRELENAVTVENIELQEQQSDRDDLEETLVKLDEQKEKLVQQIKVTRQLCYEESQQILSLQAEEVKRESQVEEYEQELARARWRLRKLKEEVKAAKKKLEEAGERNCPLQDSIRKSYEEILQEEHALSSVSGGAVTPDSQLDGSTSPADTTEDEALPVRPWGRSQSLPAYADLIMVANSAPFCNNLADTREEVDDSSSSSPKMDGSNMGDDPEEDEEDVPKEETLLHKLDFYQDDPFARCQIGHDLFDEDLFPKTDSSDGFASDPFKGSDPFAADVLFPRTDGDADAEADAQKKASTGTQCFESEFPEEEDGDGDGDGEEDLGRGPGFQPIQSSSEDLGPEPVPAWRWRGQHSVESDPNGYELDLSAVSPPSDVDERGLGGMTAPIGEEKNVPELADEDDARPGEAAEWMESGPGGSWSPTADRGNLDDQASDFAAAEWPQTESGLDYESGGQASFDQAPAFAAAARGPQTESGLDYESGGQASFDQAPAFAADWPQTESGLDYESSGQSSFDPYGFKLSPEHSSHALLDPDEEPSPEAGDPDLPFDPELLPSPSRSLDFYSQPYRRSSSRTVLDSDPYGFKLSLEEENREVPEAAPPPFEKEEPEEAGNDDDGDRQALELLHHENQEVLDPGSDDDDKEPQIAFLNRSQEGLALSRLTDSENHQLLDLCSPENREVPEPCEDHPPEAPEPCEDHPPEAPEPCQTDDPEALAFWSHANPLEPGFSPWENQEVLDSDCLGNQEVLENREVLFSPDRQEREPPTPGHVPFAGSLPPEKLDHREVAHRENEEVPDWENEEVAPDAEKDDGRLPKAERNTSSDSDASSEAALGWEGHEQTRAGFDPPTSEGDLASVFGGGGYVGVPDVADDLEPVRRRQVVAVAAPLRPVRPVRPPRPSLRIKDKSASATQGFDLK
ncbi:uncharacterized protein LOC144085813 [Stigmatopora argus]